MSILTKVGKGGHGLEAYDSETGQYVDVSCSLNGVEVNSWEKYRDAILATDKDAASMYASNPAFASQIDQLVQDQLWPDLLQKTVDDRNYLEESCAKFPSPEEAAKRMPELFGKRMVDTLLAYGGSNLFDKYDPWGGIPLVKVNPDLPKYEVSPIAAAMQMCRYPGNNRMKPITRAEFDSRRANFPSKSLYFGYGRSRSRELRDYIEGAEEIPINRVMGLSSATSSQWESVKRSYWDPESPIHSTLSKVGGKNLSFFGSVCYFSTGDVVYGSGGRHRIDGIVKLDGVKCTYCEDENEGKDIDEFRKRYRSDKNAINAELSKRLTADGRISQQQADNFCKNLEISIEKDCGLCAMIMGYDAIAGGGFQFDILNPGIVEMVTD